MTALLAILAFVLGPAAAAKDLIQSAAEAVASVLGSGFIGEFILSESGRVNPEQGFRLAWAAGVIVAAMVVLGTPEKAAAHCYDIHFSGCNSNAMCAAYCMYHGCPSGVCVNWYFGTFCVCD